MRSTILAAWSLATLAQAAVTPTAPGGGQDVYTAGQECSFEWKPDETGEWKSFDVDLFTGHNYLMRNVTRVASGLDGTASKTKYSYRCPDVDPPAPIYFYQFSLDGEEPTWTQRFTIASTNGTTVPAPNAQQPNGEEIGWGIGKLVQADSVNTTDIVKSVTSSDNEGSTLGAIWGAIGQGPEEEEGPVAGSSPTDSKLTNSSSELPGAASASSITPGQCVPSATPSSASQPPATTSANVTSSTRSHNITGFMEGRVCSSDKQCPQETPCCSEYGFCGTGRNCLAGCNPFASFQPQACAPVPACVDRQYAFDSTSSARILQNSSTWNGDATSLDWLVDRIGNNTLGTLSTNASTGESALALSLSSGSNNGTTITSTRSLLYGNVTARIKSSPGGTTGFSLISSVEEEINFELSLNVTESQFISADSNADLDRAQEEESTNLANSTSSTEYREYTLSWLPETITWLVDGVVVRNVSKNSTLDGQAQVYRYPQTPSRVRFWIRGTANETLPALDELSLNSADTNFSGSVESVDEVSYVSAVNFLCYPTSLLTNFTFDDTRNTSTNASAASINGTSAANRSRPVEASESAAPFGSPIPLQSSTEATTPTLGSTESSSALNDSASSTELAASPTSSVWWTNPAAATSAAAQAQETATLDSTSAQTWGLVNLRRVRRWIQLGKRAEQALTAYSFGSIDENGQVAVNGFSGATVLASDSSTGLDMSATDTSSDKKNGSAGSSHSVDGGKETDEDEEDDGGKSRIEKWNDLPTWAHALIIGGSILVGLLLVVLIARCFWRRASGSSATPEQAYAKIGDQGDFVAPVTPYGLSSGPYDPASASPMSQAPQLQRSSTASTTYTNGGYVPSSALRKQYFPDLSQGKSSV